MFDRRAGESVENNPLGPIAGHSRRDISKTGARICSSWMRKNDEKGVPASPISVQSRREAAETGVWPLSSSPRQRRLRSSYAKTLVSKTASRKAKPRSGDGNEPGARAPGNRATKNSQAPEGRQKRTRCRTLSQAGSSVAPPGLGLIFWALFPGLAPRAHIFRPSGAFSPVYVALAHHVFRRIRQNDESVREAACRTGHGPALGDLCGRSSERSPKPDQNWSVKIVVPCLMVGSIGPAGPL